MDYLESPSSGPNTGLMVLGFIIVIALIGFAAYWFMNDNKSVKQSKSIVIENVQPKKIKKIQKEKKEEDEEEEFVNKNIVDVVSKNLKSLDPKCKNRRYKKLNSAICEQEQQ